jgi:hypothetical protein
MMMGDVPWLDERLFNGPVETDKKDTTGISVGRCSADIAITWSL